MDGITIDRLIETCAHGTKIIIKFADTGKVIINGASSLKCNKDKRQKAKWEAFKDVEVRHVRPMIDVAYSKYSNTSILLVIEASMYRFEYDRAIAEYKRILSESDGESEKQGEFKR